MIVAVVVLVVSPILAQLIYFALSRRREYLADASGAMFTRWPEGLASALREAGSGVDSAGRSEPGDGADVHRAAARARGNIATLRPRLPRIHRSRSVFASCARWARRPTSPRTIEPISRLPGARHRQADACRSEARCSACTWPSSAGGSNSLPADSGCGRPRTPIWPVRATSRALPKLRGDAQDSAGAARPGERLPTLRWAASQHVSRLVNRWSRDAGENFSAVRGGTLYYPAEPAGLLGMTATRISAHSPLEAKATSSMKSTTRNKRHSRHSAHGR